MSKSRLNLFYSNDLLTIYGSVQTENSNVFVPEANNLFIQSGFFRAELEINDNSEHKIIVCENIIINEENAISYQFSNDEPFLKHDNYYSVPLKENFLLKIADYDNINECKSHCDRFNSENTNSVSSKIKSILPNETLSNRYLFEILLELDNKMNKILNLLETPEDNSDMESAKTLRLSGASIYFYSSAEYSQTQPIFMTNKTGKPKFCFISKVSAVIKTDKGFIHRAEIDYIDETARDNIIKFVFERDREIIKGEIR